MDSTDVTLGGGSVILHELVEYFYMLCVLVVS